MEFVIRKGNGFKAVSEIETGGHEVVLELVRSDQGDGGWSLHKPGADADDSGILSGTAEWIAGDEDHGKWSRPNDEDFRFALAQPF